MTISRAFRSGLLALALVAGCGDEGPIDPRTGFYALVSVDGDTPPTFRTATINCDYTIEGGIATLSAEGFTLTIYDGADCLRNGTPPTETTRGYTGRWERSGDSIYVTAIPLIGVDSLEFAGVLVSDDVLRLRDVGTYVSGQGVLQFHWYPIGEAPAPAFQ